MIRRACATGFFSGTFPLHQNFVCAAARLQSTEEPDPFRNALRGAAGEDRNKNYKLAIRHLQDSKKSLGTSVEDQKCRAIADHYIRELRGQLQLIRNAKRYLRQPYNKELTQLLSLNKKNRIEYTCQVAHFLSKVDKLPMDHKTVLEELGLPDDPPQETEFVSIPEKDKVRAAWRNFLYISQNLLTLVGAYYTVSLLCSHCTPSTETRTKLFDFFAIV